MMGDVVTDLLSSVARPSPSLVGRNAELDRLTRAIGLTGGSESYVRHAVVAGEAGIGKTRLLAALAELVTDSGRRVAVGHSLDFGDASLPYLPFTEIFGQLQAQQTQQFPNQHFPDQQFQAQQPQAPAQGYGYGPEGYATGYEQPAAQPYGTGYATTYGTGSYDTGTYDTGTYDTGVLGAVGDDTTAYGTAYETGSHATYDPYAYGSPGYYDTGTYDTSGLWQELLDRASSPRVSSPIKRPGQRRPGQCQAAALDCALSKVILPLR